VEAPARVTGPRNMAHHRRHSRPSLSLHMRNLLGQCILCTPKCVPHLPHTTMPTKSCTHLHLGRIVITLTVNSAYNPELLHNYRGMNCAHARLITLMTLSCYSSFPNCSSCFVCYSSTHYLTMSCVSVCECAP